MKLGIAVGITAIVSLSAGSLAGYWFAKRRLEVHYVDVLRDEIKATKAYYSRLHKKGDFETPEKTVEVLVPKEAAEALLKYQGSVEREPEPLVNYQAISNKGKEAIKNVFQKEPVDIDKEIADRTEEAPYIISLEEYNANEYEYQQNVLTYYGGDGVLADERDDQILEIDMVVGDNNIPRFGHRSEDPNILYVRNDSMGLEMEIHLNQGKYSEIVAGLTKD
jgi:hypothetical protein